MDKKIGATIMGHIGTTIRIHSFIPSNQVFRAKTLLLVDAACGCLEVARLPRILLLASPTHIEPSRAYIEVLYVQFETGLGRRVGCLVDAKKGLHQGQSASSKPQKMEGFRV